MKNTIRTALICAKHLICSCTHEQFVLAFKRLHISVYHLCVDCSLHITQVTFLLFINVHIALCVLS